MSVDARTVRTGDRLNARLGFACFLCVCFRPSAEVPAFHIVKCCNPGTDYRGVENGASFGQRASLVVPMGPQPQNESGRCQQSLGLEFLCQNSCANGIQRKQTVLVFTLENDRYAATDVPRATHN